MDQQWLSNLDKHTGLIVPTRSLATALNEQFAKNQLSAGSVVWEAPNILVWADYLRLLWQSNRGQFSDELNIHTLINPQQALLAWTQVIETSRKEEQALTLLNVQQTARAIQRSWRTMHDWRIPLHQLELDRVADIEQFARWVVGYERRLKERSLIDESQLLTELNRRELRHPFKKLVWVSYDLVTAAQHRYLQLASAAGVECVKTRPDKKAAEQTYQVYPDSKAELRAVFEQARRLLELNHDHKISIVIPDLQHRQRPIQELARDVFYPEVSPLDVQQSDAIYQFSLGQNLHEMPAIEAALSVIQLLKNRTSTTDISFLLRNRFLGVWSECQEEARVLERWLKRQRIHNLMFDHLPDYYSRAAELDSSDAVNESPFYSLLNELVAERQALQGRLDSAKAEHGFAALSFTEWVDVLSAWLERWCWRTQVGESQMNSVQYQLRQRWQSLLQEFSSLAAMQRRTGLSRALEIIQQMARNTIFLPKGADSPIIISGVLEAIGREVNSCFLTGMHQGYPTPWQPDAFVPTRLLVQAGHPDASVDTAYKHAQSVIRNLLNCADKRFISYANSSERDQDTAQLSSPLFNQATFSIGVENEQKRILKNSNECSLESYEDRRGPAWDEPGRAQGGSTIFENQSLCAFKAFATHQLGFVKDDEAEFGLDGLDRGNVVHHLLNLIWAEVHTQQALKSLDEAARADLIERAIGQSLTDGNVKLSSDKLTLLKHEQTRLKSLLLAWLELEAARPEPFSVVEREERREGELAGIRFRYIIDRVDVTNDGRSVIIDYKTGNVNRNDWLGERLKSPQMPLYSLALDQLKAKSVSGIAFAQMKRGELKFIELAEAGMFKSLPHLAKKYESLWQENRPAWPQIFEKLAQDFLAGEALVDPIDAKTCEYCGLFSLCRLPQLRDERVEHGS